MAAIFSCLGLVRSAYQFVLPLSRVPALPTDSLRLSISDPDLCMASCILLRVGYRPLKTTFLWCLLDAASPTLQFRHLSNRNIRLFASSVKGRKYPSRQDTGGSRLRPITRLRSFNLLTYEAFRVRGPQTYGRRLQPLY